jgi:peptidoglycan/xylan/chitin deacetylase (PgdA/CDA1 family)
MHKEYDVEIEFIGENQEVVKEKIHPLINPYDTDFNKFLDSLGINSNPKLRIFDVNMFEKQIKYLTENHYYFPTWQELEDYIDGKIELPAQSIILTADDGDDSFFDVAVPVLEKYNVKMTSFVVTSWYGWRAFPENASKFVYYESHTDSCHVAGAGGRGRITTLSVEDARKDLTTSSQILGGATVFAYPFGHYNDSSIKALKDTGFKLAVTVEGGRVQPGANKYQLPRVRVADGNSLQYFIKCVE